MVAATAQRIRKSPSGINVLIDPWAGLPTPEDYLRGDETVASVTAAKAWQVIINRMLADVLVCALNPTTHYLCSGDIICRTGNVVYGNQALTEYAVDSGEHSLWTITDITDVKLFGFEADGNNQGTGSYTVGNCVQIINSSRITVQGCNLHDFGNGLGTIHCGVMVYGSSYNVTIDDNDIHKTDSTQQGRASGICCAANHVAKSFFRATNNRITGGTDDSDNSGLYGGIAMLGLTSDFIVSGNTIRQAAQGMVCGYSGSANEFSGAVQNNNFYNCSLQAIYVTGGNPPGKGLLIANNVARFCGGGDALIGRATLWLGADSSDVTGNMFLHSGYTPAGVARGFNAGAIYSPQSATGVTGTITGNTIIDSAYIGIGIDGPNNLVVTGNYAESQYPYVFGVTLAGPSMALICSGNFARIKAGTVGDGFEFSGISGTPINNLLVQGNTVQGGTKAGSIGIRLGDYIVGGIISGNSCKDVATGTLVVSTTSEYLGTYVHIRGNLFTSNTVGILVSSVPASNDWVFIEPNDYIDCGSEVNVTGAGAARVKLAMQLKPRKIILNDAKPNLGAGVWEVGDQILYTASVAGKVSAYCSVAGNPGTFIELVGV